MHDEVLAEGFADELEKLGFDPVAALPAVATLFGGLYGAAEPARFDPSWVNPHWKGTGLRGRLASGALGAATVSGIAGLPKMLMEPFREDDGMTRVASQIGRYISSRGGRTALKSPATRELFKTTRKSATSAATSAVGSDQEARTDAG